MCHIAVQLSWSYLKSNYLMVLRFFVWLNHVMKKNKALVFLSTHFQEIMRNDFLRCSI